MNKETIVDGILFTFTKKVPYLSDEETKSLREIILGYLKDGISFDKSYKEWIQSLDWAK